METLTLTVSPLRKRMLGGYANAQARAQDTDEYIRAVSRFAQYLGRSLDTAIVEDLRHYQLYLVEAGTSPITLTHTHKSVI